ncbi:MAG: M48 family metalloprotease [Sulfuritalea sp.]|nr:M48 family metalloprotease [Sulfuritalea sp.]
MRRVSAGGCATNPVIKKTELTLMSEKQEIKLRSQQYLQNQQSSGGKIILDPQLLAYVKASGAETGACQRPAEPALRVCRHQRFHAQCLGYARRATQAVNRGLLTELKSEAELAAVLSHEIVHAAARLGASSWSAPFCCPAGAAVIRCWPPTGNRMSWSTQPRPWGNAAHLALQSRE